MNCCDMLLFWALASSCQGQSRQGCQPPVAPPSGGCCPPPPGCGCPPPQPRQEGGCCAQMGPGPVFRYGEQNHCGCRPNPGC